MRRRLIWLTMLAIFIGGLVALQVGPAGAAEPVKTTIWYNDHLVRTLLPPSAMPKAGTDPFYMVPGVGGVAATAPGDKGYHGGHWLVYVASGVDAADIAAYGGLNSASEVKQAALDGAITLTRRADLDFLCPIQP